MKKLYRWSCCLVVIGILGACQSGFSQYYIPKPLTLTGTHPHKTQNLIIVTLDGFRWQEVFRGADSALLFNQDYISTDTSWLRKTFWSANEEIRRQKLLPFFWDTIAQKGQIYGNRNFGNNVNLTNPYWISYPGYNEIFTGYADPKINSNSVGENPNYNVLEFINQQPEYAAGNVAAFCDWKKFIQILNVERNGLYVIAGARNDQPLFDYLRDSTDEFNRQHSFPSPFIKIPGGGASVSDYRVFLSAESYLQKHHPKVLYISFAGTDSYAHRKHYDKYLEDAYNINIMLAELWQYVQSTPQYAGKTTLFLTCDHGRGVGKYWFDHGKYWLAHGKYDSSPSETWFAVMGPDTEPLGEIKKSGQLYQNQFAATFAYFLGWEVKGVRTLGKPIKELVKN